MQRFWRAHNPGSVTGAADASQAQTSTKPALFPPALSCMSLHCRRFWQAYSRALDTHPIKVKSATSFVGFLLGDAVAQAITGARTGEAISTSGLGIVWSRSLYLHSVRCRQSFSISSCRCLRGTPSPGCHGWAGQTLKVDLLCRCPAQSALQCLCAHGVACCKGHTSLASNTPSPHAAGMSYDVFRTLRLVIFGMLMDGPIGKSGWLSACTTAAFCNCSCLLRLHSCLLCMWPLLFLLNCRDFLTVETVHRPSPCLRHHLAAGQSKSTCVIVTLGQSHACHACAAGHLWYTFLDRKVMPDNPKSNKAVVLKMMADQFLWAPFFSCIFFGVINVLQAGFWACLLCAQLIDSAGATSSSCLVLLA